jgi:electron transfer flavoprotein alpha subunit
MRGTVDVLAILVPEVDGDESASALLTTEAERIAAALGGGVAAVRFTGAEGFGASDFLERLSGYVAVVRPRIVLMLDGDLSRQIAPGLALRMGSEAVVGCTGVSVVEGAARYSKPAYGGWLEREIRYRGGALEVVTVVGSALSRPPGGVSGGDEVHERVVEVAVAAGGRDGERAPAGVTRLHLRPPEHHTVDIVYAKRIVAAGMGAVDSTPGVGAAAAVSDGGSSPGPSPVLEQLERLADLLQAATAATRPVVDEGLIAKERLVGQTGKAVAPEVYLALGISGSPHHVAGIQGADTIMAVDRDPSAPIFQFSDSGFVGDLGEVLPALIRRIEEWRDGD